MPFLVRGEKSAHVFFTHLGSYRWLELMQGLPSRTLTSNLEFRTLPLCALSYGDGNERLVGLFHQLTPAPLN